MAEKGIPDYEREARRIEEAARARADRLREAGRLQKPRSELVGELYELLGIAPIDGDRMEAGRRKALKKRIAQLVANEPEAAPEPAARSAEQSAEPRAEQRAGHGFPDAQGAGPGMDDDGEGGAR